MVVLVEKLDGTFNCLLTQNLGIMVDVVETGGMPADIMMVFKYFEIEFFLNLLMCLFLILSCLCSFIFIYFV